MYERVLAYRRSKGNRSLWLFLLACILVLAIVIVSVLWASRYQLRFRAFVGSLSNSTVYAYDNNCLRAEIDGQSVRVSGDNAYAVYTLISKAGPGRLGPAPSEEPAAVLDYGDGSQMKLWSVKLVNSSTDRAYGLFLLYTDPEGSPYAYDTDQLFLSDVTGCLSLSRNAPWKG